MVRPQNLIFSQQNDRVIVGKEYIVEANDSLLSIAKRFGTTSEALVRLFH
jgi:LysM repeat protein